MATAEQREVGRIIRTRILTHLEQHTSATSKQLADALGRKASTITMHVNMLAADGVIHSKPIMRPIFNTPISVWHLGEDPTPKLADDPVCVAVKVWPPHHVRDSLVTALFGAPRGVVA